MGLLQKSLLVIAGAGLLISGASQRVHAQVETDYKLYCARCHGDEGHGDGPDGATLKTHPRDFTDCATMAKISDDTMFKAIKDGGASVGLSSDMPAWSSGLEDDTIHNLVKYIRGFCKK